MRPANNLHNYAISIKYVRLDRVQKGLSVSSNFRLKQGIADLDNFLKFSFRKIFKKFFFTFFKKIFGKKPCCKFKRLN